MIVVASRTKQLGKPAFNFKKVFELGEGGGGGKYLERNCAAELQAPGCGSCQRVDKGYTELVGHSCSSSQGISPPPTPPRVQQSDRDQTMHININRIF